MRRGLMNILACPVCRGSLELKVVVEDGDGVTKGALLCGKCNDSYPIEDSIPNLLPPELRT